MKCIRNKHRTVDPAECRNTTRPIMIEACSLQECTRFQWVTAPWSKVMRFSVVPHRSPLPPITLHTHLLHVEARLWYCGLYAILSVTCGNTAQRLQGFNQYRGTEYHYSKTCFGRPLKFSTKICDNRQVA